MKKIDFERRLSVSMEDGGIRLIPLVSESVRVLAIDCRILSDRWVLTFSLQGVWMCQKTPQPFKAWSPAVLRNFTEGVEFWPSPDGSDFFVDVRLGRFIASGVKGKHVSRIMAALDAAAARAEADCADGPSAVEVSDLFAGDTPPVGFVGLLNVEERDFGGFSVGVVSARELHLLLSSTKVFTRWMKDNIRYLNLRAKVDYLQDSFKDSGHSRSVRQFFLTEHAARGICLIDDSPAAEGVRSYLGIVRPADLAPKKVGRRSSGSKGGTKSGVPGGQADAQPEFPEMMSATSEVEQENAVVGHVRIQVDVVLPFSIFEFQGWSIRVAFKDGTSWFVGSDVCMALGLARLSTAIRGVEVSETCIGVIRGSRGTQRFMLLSQAAVLDIATRSIKAVSVPFAAWIFTSMRLNFWR